MQRQPEVSLEMESFLPGTSESLGCAPKEKNVCPRQAPLCPRGCSREAMWQARAEGPKAGQESEGASQMHCHPENLLLLRDPWSLSESPRPECVYTYLPAPPGSPSSPSFCPPGPSWPLPGAQPCPSSSPALINATVTAVTVAATRSPFPTSEFKSHLNFSDLSAMLSIVTFSFQLLTCFAHMSRCLSCAPRGSFLPCESPQPLTHSSCSSAPLSPQKLLLITALIWGCFQLYVTFTHYLKQWFLVF